MDVEEVKIMPSAIDAPEQKQPFGNQSKQALSDQCFGQQAILQTHGHDRYGRIIGDVTCKNRSANAEQVRNGMAWVYVKYAP
jgi:endonuclease YncB( thermonuclease family)